MNGRDTEVSFLKRAVKVNAAGQTLVEFVLLTGIFLILIGVVAKKVPLTFSSATPYLGGKIQQRLETGGGFAGAAWSTPLKPKGGVGNE
jgi:hypothetical membrane protein